MLSVGAYIVCKTRPYKAQNIHNGASGHNITPLALQERGWGRGFYWQQYYSPRLAGEGMGERFLLEHLIKNRDLFP